MLLLNGITGFHVDALPEVDSLQFKRLCYWLANYSNGKILSFEEPHASQNFYKTELGLHNESIFILLNSSYPFVAFASSVQYFEIEFIDHTLSNMVCVINDGFRVLSAIETNQQLELDERTNSLFTENSLNEAELSQIFHWKPKTVGDVIFNFWD
ncbi:hypothetical protein GCM10008018_22100 [Paenibacillus marchantiophytorum]|uniref:Uncharacterized protein n=1 Tax=Paenibacillus marchantiophytorum TaxID=1619310 RepID=A0ABQ1EL61_9BACL|nr:hypothetical protein [Paenibacillus marchantiophytorum]GFZ76126.1 hypothetical protein GCM10008018_22100 [Paenibacillus marchantiophytorum]